jgi:ABC-type transporter Mla maintaining outer membrane lipid asymmetry permease subunit MlaE
MVARMLKNVLEYLRNVGEAIFFLGDILSLILRGRVRMKDVLEQMYEQGILNRPFKPKKTPAGVKEPVAV